MPKCQHPFHNYEHHYIHRKGCKRRRQNSWRIRSCRGRGSTAGAMMMILLYVFVLVTLTSNVTTLPKLTITYAFTIQRATQMHTRTRITSLESLLHRHPRQWIQTPFTTTPLSTLTPPLSTSTSPTSSTQLNGIRGFRSWFESQFPDAMMTIHHDPSYKTPTPPSKVNTNTNSSNTNSSNIKSTDEFDHVLIDINQLLHIALRRSRNEGHALTLLMKELDKTTTQIARPIQSVVLAFDGPPSAAKLATQRRRRYGTVVKSEKRERLELLIHGSTGDTLANSSNSSKKKRERIQERYHRDEKTLCITPGTAFMKKAHDAVIYWAWQRLSYPNNILARRNVKVYISPSTVAGEGEVKLLDWILQAGGYGSHRDHDPNGRESSEGREGGGEAAKRIIQPGHSVAIMGGDSDLVLEGLVISPKITHNVFVILPSTNQRSFSVSLWETTRTLSRFLETNPSSKASSSSSSSKSLPLSSDSGVNGECATSPKTKSLLKEDNDIMRVRTDLVLLLIMNGNDYLPKLRGSSGFNKLFHTYLRLLKTWLQDEQRHAHDDDDNNDCNDKTKTPKKPRPFLVDPDTLQYNIPFCIAFFRKLASIAPKTLAQPSDMLPYQNSITPLSHLYSLIDSGFLPKPVRFIRVNVDVDVDFDDDVDVDVYDVVENNDDGDATTEQVDIFNGEEINGTSTDDSAKAFKSKSISKLQKKTKANQKEVVRLVLGIPPPNHKPKKGNHINSNNSNNKNSNVNNTDEINHHNNYYQFDIDHRKGRPMKKSKQLLANIALEEILGKDYMDLGDYCVLADGGSDDDDGDEETADDMDDNDEDDYGIIVSMDDDDLNEESDGDGNDDDLEGDEEFGSMPIVANYAWEIDLPAVCKVDDYLGGLLWNLATYQDGVCANYGYNYGRRMSPTAQEIVSYFKEVQRQKQRLGREELLGDSFVPPLDDGLSCLAALPSQVQHLVPEPYRWLSVNNTVEDIYASCMDPETNVFDIDLFQRLCMEKISELESNHTSSNTDKGDYYSKSNKKKQDVGSEGRTICIGDKFWTILQKTNKPLLHPFSPPKPFSERMSRLKQNSRIKVSRIYATDRPRWMRTERRASAKQLLKGHRSDHVSGRLMATGLKHSEMGSILTNAVGEKLSLDEVQYKKAFIDVNAKARTERNSQMESSGVLGLFWHDSQQEGGTKKKQRHRINDEDFRKKQQRLCLLDQPVPLEVEQNVEDKNALQCLQHLVDAQLTLIKWDLGVPEKKISDSIGSSDPSALCERVTLTIISKNHNASTTTANSSNSIAFEQDRNINHTPRRALKQHLASMALRYLIGPQKDWTQMNLTEMKSCLRIADTEQSNSTIATGYEPEVNAENRNALQCLKELADARLCRIEWGISFHPRAPTKCSEKVHEMLTLSIKMPKKKSETLSDNGAGHINSKFDFVFIKYRNRYLISRNKLKQELAAMALNEIIGNDDGDKKWTGLKIKEMKSLIFESFLSIDEVF